MKSKYDVVFESMTPKEAAEFTKGDPEKMKFMKQIKDQKNMETYVKNTTANNQNPGTFKKLVDVDKTLEKYEDDYVNQRGKQTLALDSVGNRILKEQVKRGNINKEDLILKEDKNGLMVNKNRTIALRDSFMAKQFNRALGVNDEPEATPEQVGKLAERLERNRQMSGAAPTKLKDLEARYKKPAAIIKKKKPMQPFKFPEFKIDPVLPASYFKPTPPDPEFIRQEREFNKMIEESRKPKGLPGILGIKKYE
tara:strand:+ start:130 stop:885 length:756 start_codon:yes stop_codon:yes gene_type:complete